MASVSGTSSLGNTSLRGFGGMASGIDRDSIIEQMTLGTTTKISNKKNEITSLQWKQEAYRNVIDKILEMEDNYFSYSSTTPLVDAGFFGKNQITTLGDSDVTKYVNATGSSSMLDYISICGVKQRVTSATLTSEYKKTDQYIQTEIKNITNPDTCKTSNLEGKWLEFGVWTDADGGKFVNSSRFTFDSTYKDKDGNTVTIDYTTDDMDKLTEQLNGLLEASDVKLGNTKISEAIQFEVGGDGKLQIKGLDQKIGNDTYKIKNFSTALSALGFDASKVSEPSHGISGGDFNANCANGVIKKESMVDYLAGKTLSVTFGGKTKNIEILSKEDRDAIVNDGLNNEDAMEKLVESLNKRLTSAFGSKTIVANAESGSLRFELGENAQGVDEASGQLSQTIKINSSSKAVRDNLGITPGASNKLSLDSSLADNWEKLGFSTPEECKKQLDEDGLVINGEKIDVTSDSTINQLLSKINSSKAGVKATYLSASNQFALIASETGAGREIDVGTSGAAYTIFGVKEPKDGKDNGSRSIDGQNAIMRVSYGNGVETDIESTTDTFDLEGLKVTVSGTFGYDKTTGKYDTSKAVTFNAKADVDATTERVKKFIEEYNALVSAVNTEMTTRPDSDYGPLTDEQKDEMDETSIENWEKKAKQGLLFGDSNLRGLSDSLESMMVSLLRNGINTNELSEIGISLSDDWYDGGQLLFDESKFRDAMKNDPDKVAKLICGGGEVKTGLVGTINNSLATYATRFAYKHNGSYGTLVEVAGTSKLSRTLTDNQIYKQLKQMEEDLAALKEKLSTEEDRYISQFTTMETLISQMNSQSSYLSSLSA